MIKNSLVLRAIHFFTYKMNKYIFPFFCLILLSCGGASDAGNTDITPSDSLVEFDINEERTTAVDFNNELSLMQQDMLDGMNRLFKADSSNISGLHETLIFEAEMNLADLNEMTFDGSEVAFVTAMKDLMNWYISELNGPFIEIVPILSKAELNDSDERVLTDYDLGFASREKEAYEKVFVAQDAFALVNNIRLENQP